MMIKKNKSLFGIVWILLFSLFHSSSWGAFEYSGFENGSNDALAEEGVVSPSGFWTIEPEVGARSGSYALYGEFHEDNYNGTRATRSIEIKSDTSTSSGKRAKKNGWFAASLYIPAASVAGTDNIILQMLSYVGGTSQTKCFSINLRSDGKLGIRGYHTTTTDPVQATFSYQVPAGEYTYDSWNDIIVSFQFSRENNGFVKVWVNPADKDTGPTYSVDNVNFGSSEFWDGDTLLNGVYGKVGLYASDYTQYVGRVRKVMIDEFRFYSTLEEATLEDLLVKNGVETEPLEHVVLSLRTLAGYQESLSGDSETDADGDHRITMADAISALQSRRQ